MELLVIFFYCLFISGVVIGGLTIFFGLIVIFIDVYNDLHETIIENIYERIKNGKNKR